jgi:cyclomaltodextrinase
MLLLTTVFFTGCNNNDDIPYPKEPEVITVAGIIQLQTDSTFIVLQDYFLHPNAIDSVIMDENLSHFISPDSTIMTILPQGKSLPRLSEMKVWADGFAYSLLLEKSPKVWQRFTFDPKEKKYKKVQIMGDMNDWNPAKNSLKLKEDVWETDLQLFPGKYQYKFVVDGKQILDPANSLTIDNNIGGSNSMVYVGSVAPQGAPFLYPDKTDEHTVTIAIKNTAKEFFVMWQNYRLDESFYKVDTNGLIVTIPKKARNLESSYLRVIAYNGTGISNTVLIPISEGKPVTDAASLSRFDKMSMIIYFMMVDRFKNGNTANDAPLKDPEVDYKVNFQGGDIAGVTQKIDEGYFSGLGVNTIWVSPIVQNPLDAWTEYPPPHRKFSGYHGYWPMTLTTIDHRFGTPDEVKKMVSQAHDSKMNVLLDYVANHVHKDAALYKQHPDWATQLILPNKKKNIRLWNEQRLTTWFDEFLPTLDLSKPEVYTMMSDSALWWLKEYNLDGFRHDATKHVPEIYWRTLTRKINEQIVVPEKRPIYQIGETFGSRDLIRSYINPGKLDAQFDFSVYFDAVNAFGKDNTSFKDLNYSLYETFMYFGSHHLMGNISGNQDLTRFISLASGAMTQSESASEAGWKRDIQVKDTLGYYKLASLQAFNMTIPGVPIIYYGDEIGMPGAGDPDNRRMMRFDSLSKLENWTKTQVSKLAHLRKSSLPLLYGDFKTLEVSDKTWVYMRIYFDKVVFVVFNKDKSMKMIDFEIPEKFIEAKFISNFGNEFKIEKNKITLTLKGNAFEVITN